MLSRLLSLELFSGAGGLALGMAQSGIHHEALVEWNEGAANTLRYNFNPDIVHDVDVAGFDFQKYKNIDLIAGGPPCQPFSLGGKHAGEMDKRDMFPHACRAISECMPSVFIFENVKGLLRKSFSSYFNYIISQLTYPDVVLLRNESWQEHFKRLKKVYISKNYNGIRYNVSFKLINAADFGVPQKRERVIIIGIRDDLNLNWSFPERTHSLESLIWSQFITGEYWDIHGIKPPSKMDFYDKRTLAIVEKMKMQASLFPPKQKPWKTIRDQLSGIPYPDDKGSFHPEHILRDGAKIYPGHTGSYIDLPSKTIKAGGHGIPGGENMIRYENGTVRYFTTYEAKLLQTFPKDYRILGSWTESMRQVGNAVPVKFAQIIIQSIVNSLKYKKSA